MASPTSFAGPPRSYDGPRAEIGVIGGSGLYSFLDGADSESVELDTPWGPPSAPLTIGTTGSRTVAFLPRHGLRHERAPHLVNYRANLWALRTVGVRQVVAPCAVGSLRADLPPGSVAVPDQVIDRTWGRPHTFFDAPGAVVHVGMADPYCARGRAAALAAAASVDVAAVDGGALVVVNGPRFSTRAESRWHAAAGGSLVGMTGMPEAGLARELALCYTSMALVTDLDAGVESGEGVTQADVLAVFAANITRLRAVLHAVVPKLPSDPHACACAHVHAGQRLPFALP